MGCHRISIPRWSILSQQIPLAGIAHNCGTVRIGTDPRRSALDLHCKAHDLDNLYVVDASFFPSSSAVNPGLTTIANALRVGDHLLERLGTSSAAGHERNELVRADTETVQPHETELERVEPR
jgi:choline dehydrogenase-like flavoprotein